MQYYTQLRRDDRMKLDILLRVGKQQKEIAKLLNKHPSTISREIRRNKRKDGGYSQGYATTKLCKRRKDINQRFRKITNNVWLKKYVIEKLRVYWSPEQIAGRLKRENGRAIISHEAIYQFIYKDAPELKRYLRCQRGKYKHRYGTRKREKEREAAKKQRIDTRPEVANERKRAGDWEGDTVLGEKGTGRILTHVERLSGYLLADKIEKVKAEIVRTLTIARFQELPEEKRHTITYDNGPEFSDFEMIELGTKMTVYFAYPYHSWERGTNENTNGLLRQFFPKKTSFTHITQKKLEKVVYLINTRPRKRLDYLSPEEVFNCTSV